MKRSARHLAVEILHQVNASHDFASPLINQCLDQNALSGMPDGRLLTHLVYGVLRFRGYLDWILARLYHGDFEALEENIKNVLRLGLYQLKFSDKLPDFAVVNEAVKIAKTSKPDRSALVNAVLRNYLRRGDKIPFPSLKKDPAQHIAAFYSHPLWLVKQWLKLFGPEETISLCSANNELPPLTLRVNTLKISRDNIKQKLADAGFDLKETPYSHDGLILNASTVPIQKTDFFARGLVRIQDEAAQLISYLVNPEQSESVFDACTGTGGKVTHLAAILDNKGLIVAVDRDQGKISELKQEIIRLGINNIEAQTVDLNVALPNSFKHKFDCVLVDAPCSGTGTLRRNPEIKWRTRQQDIPAFAAAQKVILKNASRAVQKGGRIIYCTCSLLPEENENIINDFLKHEKNFSLALSTTSMSSRLFDQHGFLHTYPHRHNMDGFFGAVLKYQ